MGAGLSHYCEHLLFKGTTKRPTGQLDQDIRGGGGDNNAYTNSERTVYHATTAASSFATAFDAIADMVAESTFPPEEVKKEHGVVRKELERASDDPDRALYDTFEATVYQVHPYRVPGPSATSIASTASLAKRSTPTTNAATAPQHGVHRGRRLRGRGCAHVHGEDRGAVEAHQRAARAGAERARADRAARGRDLAPPRQGAEADPRPPHGVGGPLRPGRARERARQRALEPPLPDGQGPAEAGARRRRLQLHTDLPGLLRGLGQPPRPPTWRPRAPRSSPCSRTRVVAPPTPPSLRASSARSRRAGCSTS